MGSLASVQSTVFKRDGFRCTACRTALRPTLAVHHIAPVHLGGSNAVSNLTTLCANCHRVVHWLSAGDRSLSHESYSLGLSRFATTRVRLLARRIRTRRLREYGADRTQLSSVSLDAALAAVRQRNGFETSEAQLLKRCIGRALRAMRSKDRTECSKRIMRGATCISINAGNHLVARVPAWSDDRVRMEDDLLLIWPTGRKPSIWTEREFRRRRGGAFHLIPYTNIGLSWEECLSLTGDDWKLYRQACDDALHMARTRSWQSNIILH